MIVATPDICGGNPRVIGTRIPVWVLARYKRDDLVSVLEDYPALLESEVLEAWRYADTHAAEIERQRRENEGR